MQLERMPLARDCPNAHSMMLGLKFRGPRDATKMGRMVSAKTEHSGEALDSTASETPAEKPEETARRLLALLEAALEEKDALERQLEQAGGDTLAARLRALAHELRGPLNAIIGFSDIIRGRVFGDDLDRYVEYAGDIHTSGLHLLELIETSLQAVPTETNAEPIDAVALAVGVLRLVHFKARAAGITLVPEMPTGALMVRARPRALRQILLNLLENALKFTPRDGLIALTVRAEGQTVRLTVADTGIGIPQAEAARIFERDYRIRSDPRHLRAGGTGLGLSIARDLARGMGGELSVESAPAQGASFTLTLPRAEA
ncbi:MAG: HAMP domain-containing histidine kinase [Alphaproteobacteria bacterium]|nr:HAMP domain-containing histidine kinase [Alphaproteobacteria bacterium]